MASLKTFPNSDINFLWRWKLIGAKVLRRDRHNIAIKLCYCAYPSAFRQLARDTFDELNVGKTHVPRVAKLFFPSLLLNKIAKPFIAKQEIRTAFPPQIKVCSHNPVRFV